MSLLKTWYGSSDCEVKERVNNSLGFMEFLGPTLEDTVPHKTVLSRFRAALAKADTCENLLENINNQLEKKEILDIQ